MPQLSCCVQITRGLLFALNIIFLLVGFTVMGLGIYIKTSGSFAAISNIYSLVDELEGEPMQWVGVGMIVAGILTVCLSALGCLGAVLHNRCLLYSYSISLILITFFEFATVVVMLVFRDNVWRTYDSDFMEIFHNAYSKNDTKAIKAIENLEIKFECCGVDNSSDYINFGYTIPSACYPQQSIKFHPYYIGCAEAVNTWVWNHLPTIIGILVAVLFIEIFGVTGSLVLGVAITHSTRNEQYAER